jgi:leader peptidase (prepilin peptidase)/N-methyltransferase
MGSVLCAVTAVILFAISFTDAKRRKIPNILIMALLVVGIASMWVWPEIHTVERLIGIFIISVPLCIVAAISPGSLGGGDIKLVASAGLLLGWKGALAAFLVAALVGGVYSVFLLFSRKKSLKDSFAFGPFLCAGILLAFIFVT